MGNKVEKAGNLACVQVVWVLCQASVTDSAS